METSVCPKNQKRCCHKIAPPDSGLKICASRRRSAPRPNSAEANGGNTIRIRRLVNMVFHGKIGMRKIVMRGARSVITGVKKLTAPKMVPKPASARPNTHRSPPNPGVKVAFESGVYPNHPKEAAPCGVKKPPQAMTPPNR